jgi:hypothetical protein
MGEKRLCKLGLAVGVLLIASSGKMDHKSTSWRIVAGASLLSANNQHMSTLALFGQRISHR